MPESLFRKWRMLPWVRRMQILSVAWILLLVLFYAVENMRGSRALRQAEEFARDSGWEPDLDVLDASGERPEDSENFGFS